ncbi:hypothetical protein RvY_04553 [Ramazzottius varieornatus]|uniref:Uncharacterized protein n=1 Tax=Ramazzottius varieornatus TaxID=947166 RepID=A0A1D1UYQ4_RAMVA|nr:hypothetical protein RvY_04553 [Ramazzottius varieornatus]
MRQRYDRKIMPRDTSIISAEGPGLIWTPRTTHYLFGSSGVHRNRNWGCLSAPSVPYPSRTQQNLLAVSRDAGGQKHSALTDGYPARKRWLCQNSLRGRGCRLDHPPGRKITISPTEHQRQSKTLNDLQWCNPLTSPTST